MLTCCKSLSPAEMRETARPGLVLSRLACSMSSEHPSGAFSGAQEQDRGSTLHSSAAVWAL